MFRQMLENKRGVSNVVTTVLIILLALAAVAVLAAFILPTIRQTSTSAGQQTACFDVQVTPLDCVNTSSDGITHFILTLNATVRHDGGSGIKQVKVIVADPDGNTVLSPAQDISPFGTVTFSNVDVNTLAETDAGRLSVRAIAIVDDGQGGTAECPPSPTVITCHSP